MRAYHDIGGLAEDGPIDHSEHLYAPWEKRVDALVQILVNTGTMTLDEHRRMQESVGDKAYREFSYYERWMAATTHVLLSKGCVTSEEIGKKLIEVEARLEQGDDRAF